MADNSGINRRVDGQGNTSSSGPPQVELQLEESSFDLLVQDRGDGCPEHLPNLVGRLSLDATPASHPIINNVTMQSSLEGSAPSVPPTLMSTSNQSASYDPGVSRSSLPAPPLLPEIPQGHPHIIDIISDFDSDDLSLYSASAPRPNVVPTPPTRPRAPSPPSINPHRSNTSSVAPLLNANDPLSIADLSARMRQLSERLEALNERAGERRRSYLTNGSGLLGPLRRAPQRASISATSSSRSPELPPIDVSEGLTSMLTLDNHTPRAAETGLDTSRNSHNRLREENRVHSTSVQPPNPNRDASGSSSASATWDYVAERARHRAFEEAIAVIRPTPPPPSRPPRLPDPLIGGEPLSSSLRPLGSRRISSGSRISVNPRSAIWSQSSSQVSSPTTSQSVPTLPPISSVLSRSLEAITADSDLSDGSWEEEEEPSQWLRETRRVLGRPADGNRRTRSASPPAPVLQLPNFSTASLGLGDYHQGHPPASPVRSTRTRPSMDSLRHAVRTQRRSQSMLSALSADDRLLPLPASPPAISDDEPFERAVLAELESRMTQPGASTSHNHNNSQRSNFTNNTHPRGPRFHQSPTGVHRPHAHTYTTRAGPSNPNRPPSIVDDNLDLEPGPTREFSRVLQDRLRTREGPGDLALLPDLMEELEASYQRYTTERAEPVRNMRRALFRSLDGEEPEEREASYQRRTSQHMEPPVNRRRRLLSVHLPDEEDSEEQPSETIITRRRVDTTTSTTSNRIMSGRFRRTFERRQFLMVGQLSEPEQGPIPDSDYSSTDEMFNLTRGLRELGQFVMERDPARESGFRRRRINSNIRANTLGDFVSDVVFDTSYEALMDLGEQIGAVPRGLPPHITAALPSKTFGELDPSFVAQSPLAASVPLSSSSKGKATVRTTTTVKAHCSICLDEFIKHDLCITLECAHFFHQNCVLEWFRGASTCPLCRRPAVSRQ